MRLRLETLTTAIGGTAQYCTVSFVREQSARRSTARRTQVTIWWTCPGCGQPVGDDASLISARRKRNSRLYVFRGWRRFLYDFNAGTRILRPETIDGIRFVLPMVSAKTFVASYGDANIQELRSDVVLDSLTSARQAFSLAKPPLLTSVHVAQQTFLLISHLQAYRGVCRLSNPVSKSAPVEKLHIQPWRPTLGLLIVTMLLRLLWLHA